MRFRQLCPVLQLVRLSLVAFLPAWQHVFSHAQGPSGLLPTGMSITPRAPRGVVFQALNPGLPTLPDFKAGVAVTAALSPDGDTLLVLTSGFNQNLDSNGNVDPATSNEYVFVYDVSGEQPLQKQVLQIQTNAFDGLAWNPEQQEFYVSGGPGRPGACIRVRGRKLERNVLDSS
jgi:hypothetical protein